MNKEKIRSEAGESDSVRERSADSMEESVKNLLHGIRNSVRGFIRNVALVTQLSIASLGVAGCDTSPDAEGQDHPGQCISKIFPSKPDNTPQCDGKMSTEPHVKNVTVCFMRWSNSYDLTDAVKAQLHTEFDLATQFFTEATFGRDVYTFNLIDSGTVWAMPYPAKIDDDVNLAIQACAPQIDDFHKIDTFVVFPSFDDFNANGQRKIVSTPDGDTEMGVIRLPHYTKISKTSGTLYPDLHGLRHEIGHTDLLLNHASEYVCSTNNNDGKSVTYNPNPSRCGIGEYGNRYDLMGGGFALSDKKSIFGHPGGFEKSLNGLVKVTNISKNSGTYPLAALEVPCSNVPQLLRIPYAKIPLCLEYRRPIGFDADFPKENTPDKFGAIAGLPSDGCVLLQICSNDPTTLLKSHSTFGWNVNGATFLLYPILANDQLPQGQDRGACLPREGFCDSNLGIDVSYSQSTTNPNAVMVNVSGVDETRLAKLPNLMVNGLLYGSSNFTIENVSETGESVGTFDIQISGKRISDGQFELIETRTIDGLPLFGKVAINFSPDQLKSLRLIYSELRGTADSGNVIEETDETDNEEVTSGHDF